MNKTQLVDALAARMGDRRSAATAVDCLLQTIVDTVGAGDSVSITGFGVFEARARAARVARNPRTGELVDVAATTVPAFRPGSGFRTAVAPARPPAETAPKPARRAAKAASFAAEAPAAASTGRRKPATRAKAAAAATATVEKVDKVDKAKTKKAKAPAKAPAKTPAKAKGK